MKKNHMFTAAIVMATIILIAGFSTPAFAQFPGGGSKTTSPKNGQVIEQATMELPALGRAFLYDVYHDVINPEHPTCKWDVTTVGTRVRYPDGSGSVTENEQFVRFEVGDTTENQNMRVRFAEGVQSETKFVSEVGTHLTFFMRLRTQGFAQDSIEIGWRPEGSSQVIFKSVFQFGWFLDRQTGQYWPSLIETYRNGIRIGATGHGAPVFAVTATGQVVPQGTDELFAEPIRHIMVPTQFAQGPGNESIGYFFSVPEWAEGQRGQWEVRFLHSPSSPEVQALFGPNVVFAPPQ